MTAPPSPGPAPKPQHAAPIAAPTGTRDLYPIELARRRFIEDKWRKVAIRHGFDEIDGPTFEHASLYAVKSGDGILGELFQTFSGKDEERVKKMGAALATGERGGDAMAPYALRPEFTPTLARMYAARAKQLPQPTKWFWQGTCFRAERPQRGRLREFWQWNCDIIGGADSLSADVEAFACCVDLLQACGLTPADVTIKISDRTVFSEMLVSVGIQRSSVPSWLVLIDRFASLSESDRMTEAARFGATAEELLRVTHLLSGTDPEARHQAEAALHARGLGNTAEEIKSAARELVRVQIGTSVESMNRLAEEVAKAGLLRWFHLDTKVVRGLAYYTGMVFEVHETSGAMRAIAGGGRYDNLIELFGGPPTPAVGFGMGDVVLSLVLQDKKGPDGKALMPSDRDIAAALGLRPDAFVISNGLSESDAQVAPLLASLRRAGLHARRSYKSTKNIGKLLKEGADAGARFAVIIENGAEATVKDLDTNQQRPDKVPLASVPASIPAPTRP
ncbi:MAG: histidine--tRNA ligase [Phycisphaerales bacterium]